MNFIMDDRHCLSFRLSRKLNCEDSHLRKKFCRTSSLARRNEDRRWWNVAFHLFFYHHGISDMFSVIQIQSIRKITCQLDDHSGISSRLMQIINDEKNVSHDTDRYIVTQLIPYFRRDPTEGEIQFRLCLWRVTRIDEQQIQRDLVELDWYSERKRISIDRSYWIPGSTVLLDWSPRQRQDIAFLPNIFCFACIFSLLWSAKERWEKQWDSQWKQILKLLDQSSGHQLDTAPCIHTLHCAPDPMKWFPPERSAILCTERLLEY